ncbi:MAG: hypothetical protein JW888_16980 [Pirellulales bacterium]|nr:hypothetical protein [Pirellulales bacterium]
MKRLIVLLGLLALLVGTTPSYGTVTVVYEAGTLNLTEALTGFGTTGDLMEGMTLTALFGDNSTETATWASLGAPSGKAQGTGWFVSESGDTWDQNWTLQNNTGQSLVSLVIDAGLGDTVFDAINGNYLTPGSANGKPFQMTGGDSSLNILATYYDEVALDGTLPMGDLYRFLRIDFLNAGQFSSGSTMTFVMDTDNIQFAGDINPVPEPATLLIWSVLGALAVAAWRWR